MTATTDRVFFDGYLDAWNAHDPAAVARYMADDAIYEDVALGRVLRGPSAIAGFVEEATRASSDFRFEQVSLFIAGSDYANEWIMTGTNDREAPGVPATGRSFRVRGASVGKLDASARIVENRDYYNLAEMFTQLGIQPPAPSKSA
ncbi:MAG TPA: ester cyclase [Candidatus Eisenbacteria bacterium]|nr:ester cyclase [Candidatus Eisenbacteria bacterium]